MTVWMAEKFLFLPRIPEKKVSLADMATVVCLVIAVEESSFVGLSEKCTFFPRACRGVSAILLLKASAVILTTPYELLRGSHFSSFICMIFNTLEVTARGQKTVF